MSDPDVRRIIEAVLFAADSPVNVDRLVEIVGQGSRSDVRNAIDELNAEYETGGHSFRASEIAGGWQLYVRPEYSDWVKELHRGRTPARLSQAALETLAIVAYKQPIVRTEIEIIRGVDSSGVLATLLRRGLITIAGRAPGMGRALMYSTTKEFLRYFGLNTVTDLPRLEEFAEVLGLRPDELELALEGAEAMAGMANANGEPVDGATEDTSDDLADDAEHGHEGTDPGPREAGAGTTEEPERPDGDGVLMTSVGAREPEPGEDPHAIHDLDIIESLDET